MSPRPTGTPKSILPMHPGYLLYALAGEKLGAPSFALFAKGGYDAACSAGFDSTEIS